MKQKENSSLKQMVPALRFPEFSDAEDWILSKLGDIATFINGRAYSQSELLEKGKYRVLRVGNFFSNNNWYYSDLELEDDKYCDYGDLLYAWSASFGPRIWIGEKVIYHYHIWKVLPNELVLKQFLCILLAYETEKIKSQSAKGLGLLHITKGSIESWKTPIPSLPEQQKIADCLSSLDEVIYLESQKLQSLQSYKKGLLQNLFPSEGETVPKLRFPEFEGTGDWEERKLGDVATPVNERANETQIHNILSLTAESGLVLQSDYFGKKIAGSDVSRYIIIKEYDFVYNDRTTKSYPYGALKRLENIDSGIVSPIYKCFRFGKNQNSSFWSHYFESGLHEIEIKKLVNEGARAGRFNISISQFLSISVKIPSASEQQKIADCLSSVDAMIQEQSERVEGLKSHKKGLLQGLFPVMGE